MFQFVGLYVIHIIVHNLFLFRKTVGRLIQPARLDSFGSVIESLNIPSSIAVWCYTYISFMSNTPTLLGRGAIAHILVLYPMPCCEKAKCDKPN